MKPVQRIPKKMVRLITFSDFYTRRSTLFFQLKPLKLQDHIKLQTLYLMHQFLMGKLTKLYDSFLIKTSDKHNVKTRCATRNTIYVPKTRTNYHDGKFNIPFNGPIDTKVILQITYISSKMQLFLITILLRTNTEEPCNGLEM